MKPLRKKGLSANPFDQFRIWFQEAHAHGQIRLPEAMCLSTISADADGYPEGRMVLLKSFDEGGFIFYTNLKSPKGLSLLKTPRAALTFYWAELGRQVRVVGDVDFLDPAASDEYFRSRPHDSQIGAWASEQSSPIAGRKDLEASFSRWEAEFAGLEEIPRPDFWQGIRVVPRNIEFWQEQPNRLHDRFRYDRTGDAWMLARLAP